MSYHSHFYLVCTHCRVRQYIGADLEILPDVLARLTAGAQDPRVMQSPAGEQIVQALRGVGDSFTLALKFLKRHHGHPLVLWNATEETAVPFVAQAEDDVATAFALYPDEWVFDTARSAFDAPSWYNILPLGAADEVGRLQAEVDRWREAYQQEFVFRNQLEQRIHARNPEKMRVLRQELTHLVQQTFTAAPTPVTKDYEASVNEALAVALEQHVAAPGSPLESIIATATIEEEG